MELFNCLTRICKGPLNFKQLFTFPVVPLNTVVTAQITTILHLCNIILIIIIIIIAC